MIYVVQFIDDSIMQIRLVRILLTKLSRGTLHSLFLLLLLLPLSFLFFFFFFFFFFVFLGEGILYSECRLICYIICTFLSYATN